MDRGNVVILSQCRHCLSQSEARKVYHWPIRGRLYECSESESSLNPESLSLVITWLSLLQASEQPTYSLQHFRERSLESWTGLCNPVIFLGLLEMRNCWTIWDGSFVFSIWWRDNLPLWWFPWHQHSQVSQDDPNIFLTMHYFFFLDVFCLKTPQAAATAEVPAD